MDKKPFFIVGGVAAAFLLLIILNQPGPKDPAVADVVSDQLAPISDSLGELGERVSGLETTLEGLSERVDGAASADALAEVQAQVETALSDTAALRSDLDGVQVSLSEAPSAIASEVRQPAGEAEEAQSQTPTAQAAEVLIADGEGISPGETALFADGALRLFVSRVNPTAKEVRVSVNGDMKTLRLGQARVLAAGDDYCSITPDAIAGNAVTFAHLCGDDLPPPEGLSAGETALFEDGNLRVFASRMGEDEARLVINQETFTIALGRSVPAMAEETPCRVYLDGLDRGHAMVSALCGADVPVSEAVGPGETVILGDGAARVFVAAVQDGTARFAINGQTVVSGGSGDRIALQDGCEVTVEDLTDGSASFSYACE